MSTKPYLYFEQIMNGIVSIPESVQDKLKNVMLVRQEELQKQEELRKQEQEQEENPGLLSWFKSKKEEPTKEQEPIEESGISSWFKESTEKEEPNSTSTWFNTKETKEESPKKEEGILSWLKDKESTPTNVATNKKCNIRGW